MPHEIIKKTHAAVPVLKVGDLLTSKARENEDVYILIKQWNDDKYVAICLTDRGIVWRPPVDSIRGAVAGLKLFTEKVELSN